MMNRWAYGLALFALIAGAITHAGWLVFLGPGVMLLSGLIEHWND